MTATAQRLEGISEYYFSKKLREIEELNKAGKQVINLGIGSPDLPPHPSVIKVLSEEAAKPNTHAYQSYKGSGLLRAGFADFYQRVYGVNVNPETEILPLIGSKEGVVHICMTFLNEGDRVFVPNPGYPAYAAAVKLAGAIPVPYTLQESENWYPDFNELELSEPKGIKLMFLNYPNMPTGARPERKQFENFVRFARKHDILLVHDNPYSMVLNPEPESIFAVPGAFDCALELNSLSKSGNMAGWRVGALIGRQQYINDVLRFKSNMDSGMFLPVQLAAAQALSLGPEWYEYLNGIYRERRIKVETLLSVLKCRYEQAQTGMFVWAKIPEGYKNGFEFSDAVLNSAFVFITPGGIFGDAGENYIRVSLCAPAEVFERATERCRQYFK